MRVIDLLTILDIVTRHYVKLRIATFNIGTMSGRSTEIVEIDQVILELGTIGLFAQRVKNSHCYF